MVKLWFMILYFMYFKEEICGRRPTKREIKIRSKNNNLTSWNRFYDEGWITDEQHARALLGFRVMFLTNVF